jgi:uncharacterized Tic20 family protein
MDQNMDSPNPNSEDQPQTPPQPEPAAPESTPQRSEVVAISQDSKNMAMLCHLLAIFTVFLCPLLIWLIKKDQDEYVNVQGKEALNFQLTITFAMIASWVLIPVLIGIPLVLATAICDLVFCIMGTVATSKGSNYRYPVSLRLVK